MARSARSSSLIGEALPPIIAVALAYFGLKILVDEVPNVETAVANKLAAATPGVNTVVPVAGGGPSAAASATTSSSSAAGQVPIGVIDSSGTYGHGGLMSISVLANGLQLAGYNATGLTPQQVVNAWIDVVTTANSGNKGPTITASNIKTVYV